MSYKNWIFLLRGKSADTFDIKIISFVQFYFANCLNLCSRVTKKVAHYMAEIAAENDVRLLDFFSQFFIQFTECFFFYFQNGSQPKLKANGCKTVLKKIKYCTLNIF